MGTGRVARIVVVGVAVQLAALGGAVTLVDRLRQERAGATDITGPERALILGAAGPATVRVTGRGCATVTGTGFVVGGRLLTNAHVAAGAATLDLRPDRTTPGPAGALTGLVALVAADPAHDLAVTRALDPVPPGLELAPGDPVAGEAVLVVGRGQGPLHWLEARVQLRQGGSPYGIDGPVVLLDRAVEEGWSGGPVLDHRGRVVGLVKGVDRATGLTIVVPVSTLRATLGAAPREVSPAGPSAGPAGSGAGAGGAGCG